MWGHLRTEDGAEFCIRFERKHLEGILVDTKRRQSGHLLLPGISIQPTLVCLSRTDRFRSTPQRSFPFRQGGGGVGCNVRFMNNVTFRFGWFAGHIYGNPSWWNNDKIMHVFPAECSSAKLPWGFNRFQKHLGGGGSAANAHLDMDWGGTRRIATRTGPFLSLYSEVLFYYWCPLETFFFPSFYSPTRAHRFSVPPPSVRPSVQQTERNRGGRGACIAGPYIHTASRETQKV